LDDGLDRNRASGIFERESFRPDVFCSLAFLSIGRRLADSICLRQGAFFSHSFLQRAFDPLSPPEGRFFVFGRSFRLPSCLKLRSLCLKGFLLLGKAMSSLCRVLCQALFLFYDFPPGIFKTFPCKKPQTGLYCGRFLENLDFWPTYCVPIVSWSDNKSPAFCCLATDRSVKTQVLLKNHPFLCFSF